MFSMIDKLLYGLARVIGYTLAFPGNLLWKFGYNGYYGFKGGKVAIVNSVVPKPPTPTPTASAPVTPAPTATAAAAA